MIRSRIMWLLLLILGMFSVQIGASFAKGLFSVIGPLASTTLRISFAAIILCLMWRPWATKLPRRSYKIIILYGICLGSMNISFYLALIKIPLGLTVALEFLGPLTVALMSSKKKIDIAWVMLAALGVFLIVPLNSRTHQLSLSGIFFALLAGLFWGLYILLGKKAGQLGPGGLVTAIGMSVAALISIPFGVSSGQLQNLTPTILFWGLGVGVLSSVIPYSLDMVILKKIPTQTFGILMSLEPVIAALAGLVLLHEQLTISQWMAIACIMAASAGTTMSAHDLKPSQVETGLT